MAAPGIAGTLPQSLDRLQAAMAAVGAVGAVGDQPGASVERFNQAMRPLLAALRHHVRREMAYLRARGDLEGDFPSADDVIDESLARAFRDAQQEGAHAGPTKHSLFRIVHAVLAEAVKRRRKREGRFVSLERTVSKTRALGETLDEAIYDFWQPDEVLKLEDVLPDKTPNPEDVASQAELRRVLARLLSQLPDVWRRAVLLTQAEDFARADVAQQLGVTEVELARCLEHADAFLRARLAEFGIRPSSGSRLLQPSAPPAAGALLRNFDRACGHR